jgi:hypothetical protein
MYTRNGAYHSTLHALQQAGGAGPDHSTRPACSRGMHPSHTYSTSWATTTLLVHPIHTATQRTPSHTNTIPNPIKPTSTSRDIRICLLHKQEAARVLPLQRPASLQVYIAAGKARKASTGAPYTSSHAQTNSSAARENVKNPGALTSRDNKCW